MCITTGLQIPSGMDQPLSWVRKVSRYYYGGFYIKVHCCRVQHVNDPNESQSSTAQCKVNAESSHSPKVVKSSPAIDFEFSNSESDPQQIDGQGHNNEQRMPHAPHPPSMPQSP